MEWNSTQIRTLVRSALEEDAAHRDKTTQLLIPAHLRIEVAIRAKQNGVICGLPLARKFFVAMDRQIVFQPRVQEGGRVKKGDVLARATGKAWAVLSAERPALNAVQHLSGIATYTREQVDRLGPFKTQLLDTRKTLPAWRTLQKYAVHCGGGINHRSSLAEAILVKENHLMVCRLAKVDWKKIVRRAHEPVQLEVQTENDLREAVALKPAKILLDNLAPGQLRRFIAMIHRRCPKTRIEISGGVRPEQLRTLGRLGADYVSMGRLTHSVKSFDCSLDILRVLP